VASQDFFVVAETFYSVQGEGPYMGRPAVFLRLAGCNLQCQGFSYQDPKTQEHLGCDSKHVWRFGKKKTFAELLTEWQQQGWTEKLAQGAHLIITGGEPFLQQQALRVFFKLIPEDWFIEVETNGTRAVLPEVAARINHFNISPKLSNSGERFEDAYHPEVLSALLNTDRAILKFVISQASDVEEILKYYLGVLPVTPQKIWLMPEGGTRAAIDAKKAWLIELCKTHHFNFSTRLQIDVWDEVTGV